jgi:SAM-dependent methyltransferase
MRADLDIIQHWIAPGSRVLDLGCGDGSLLEYLKRTKGVSDTGLEIDERKIHSCLEKGVNVLQQDLNKSLKNFCDKSFDTVLLTQTSAGGELPRRADGRDAAHRPQCHRHLPELRQLAQPRVPDAQGPHAGVQLHALSVV